ILDHVFGFYAKHDLPVEIFCDGYGDIFASRSYLDFFEETALPTNVRLTITTNGTTIHQYHDLINKIKPNIHSMVISLDAGTANTYQVIRNSNFDQVIDNCEWLRHNGIVTHGQFVLQRNNQNEIVKYYELGQRLGFKTTSMQLLDRWGHHTDQWWNHNQVAVDQKLIDELELLSQHNVQMCGGIKQLIAKHHNLP
ncbi:MAG: radical SAM protein, partial [Candidatus Poseidoniales archaeon]